VLSPSHPNVDPSNHSIPIPDIRTGGIYSKEASRFNIDSTPGVQDKETNISESDHESVDNYGVTETDSSPTIDPGSSEQVTFDVDDVYTGDIPEKMNIDDQVEDDEKAI
jgi:hypothetical protein